MKLGHLERCLMSVALTWSAVLVLSVNSLSIRREPVTEQVLIITTPDSLLQDEGVAATTTQAENEVLSDDATTVETIVLHDSTGESWEVDPTASSIVSKDVEIEIAGSENKVSLREKSHDVDKPILPEIYSFRVQSDIKYRYSRTYVTSRVANKDAKRAQEVTFSVVLPETAFISKFVMEIDGKPYEAYVKEKEEAKKDYQHAQSQGLSAGLVEKSTRNSNVFNVNVNVKPQSKVTFNLTYEELLTRRLGRYEQAININPDQVSSIKDYKIIVNIEESRNLTVVNVPSISNDIDGQMDPTGNNKDAVIERPAPNKASISWSPTTSDQKKLVKEGNSGKFVVQYDVDREGDAGQILVMQGYFVHFFAPENLPPLKKHVVFILDISGSMWGRKMEQLKESQKKILNDLSPDDFFNIITFSSDVYLWSPKDKVDGKRSEFRAPSFTSMTEITPPELAAKKQPIPASPENINKAKLFIDSLVASGGTNIHDAIIEALNLTACVKEAQNKDGSPVPEAITIDTTVPASSPSTTTTAEASTTTGAASTTSQGTTSAASTTTTTTSTTSTAAPPSSTTEPEEEEENTSIVIVDIAKSDMDVPDATDRPDAISAASSSEGKVILPPNVQSMIIFLTDGEPTVGITDPPEIQKLIQSANRNLSIPIFSLGFGEGADFPFLKKLSLQNYGFGRKIYEASDASLQLQGFYNEIASPLLSNVKFNYTSSEYNVTDLTITKFSTIFGGTEIAVAGKLVAPPKPIRHDAEETTIAPSNDAGETTQFTSETQTPRLNSDDYSEDDEPIAPGKLSISCAFNPLESFLFDVNIEGSGRDGEIDLKNAQVLERQCIDFPIPFIPDRFFPPRPTPPPSPEDIFLERLWAYLTIQQLIEKDLAIGDSSSDGDANAADNNITPSSTVAPEDSSAITTVLPNVASTSPAPSVKSNSSKPETPKEQALRLALKYGFVTPLTSLVVVKPNSSDVTNAVAADGRPDMADSFYAGGLSFAAPILANPMLMQQAMHRMHVGRSGSFSQPQISGKSLSIPRSNSRGGTHSLGATGRSYKPNVPSTPYYTPQSMPVLALAAPAAYVKTAPHGFINNRIASHPIQANYALANLRPIPFAPYSGGPPPPFSLGSQAVNQASVDYGMSSSVEDSALIDQFPVAHPLPSQLPFYPSTSVAPSTSTQSAPLTLSDITWLKVNVDVLRVNETDYKIARNETTGVLNYECTIGSNGGQGQCSLLQDCVLPAFANNEETFRTLYFCPLQSSSSSDNFVGTCCPSSRVKVDAENGQM